MPVESMLGAVGVVPNPASRSDDRDAEAAAVRLLTRFHALRITRGGVFHTRVASAQTNLVREGFLRCV